MQSVSTKRDNRFIWLAIAAIFLLASLLLWRQGRQWICSCGYVLLWAGDIWRSDNSQHILDPYSFTHVLHGFVFLWLIALIQRWFNLGWLTAGGQMLIALFIEAAWEVAENTNAVIDRYREATIALDYAGDTIINALADIVLCGVGVWLARRLGFWRILALLHRHGTCAALVDSGWAAA